jgi:hypothetical protein
MISPLPTGTLVSVAFENEIKDTTERDRFGSYLDLHLEIDNEGRKSTKLYDKRDDINFPIVDFPFMQS